MNRSNLSNRRQFVRQAVGGVALLGAATASERTAQSAEPKEIHPATKANISIGTRITPDWLDDKNDTHLKFLKQCGVDAVDIELIMVSGYRENGIFSKASLQELMARFEGVGLRIERANALGPYALNAHLNLPAGQAEIDNMKRIGELLSDARIPVYGIQCCQASQLAEEPRKGWSEKQGRGGYTQKAFDLKASRTPPPKPKIAATADQLWQGLLNIYRQVMPTVEGSKTRIAMHGNDPPLYEHLGSPQIICRFADFERLYNEVPSRHNGMTFCVGTRYESGENVLEGIRRFGRQGKIFHVHFRNVQGTLPSREAYSEALPDDGDLNMADVLRALIEVGYDGVIDYDHAMGVAGDDPLRKQYIAFAIGHMRGLLQALNLAKG